MTLQTQTITNAAYERIKSDILSGKYKPGEHLREKDLCDDLQVSRTPVRDALVRLGQEGLVVLKPHKGVFVRKFTKKNIQDYYQTRAILEGLGAKLAAKHVTESSKEQLLSIIEKMKETLYKSDQVTEGNEAIIKLNNSFHDYVFEIANNEVLDQMRKTLAYPIALIRSTSWISKSRRLETLKEHDNIAKAIVNEDEEKARKLAEQHIYNAWQTAESNWDKLPNEDEQ